MKLKEYFDNNFSISHCAESYLRVFGGLTVLMRVIAGRFPSIHRMCPYRNARIHIVVVTGLAYVLFVSNTLLSTLKL